MPTEEWGKRMLNVMTSLAIIIAAVYLLAVVTDRFFIVSLDQISQRLKLSDEVAGASLMAVGSSAPELAIALMALFTNGGAHSDVGIGTIVGSAVFNILVITGVSALVAGGLHIHIFAVRRDTFYYLVSIAYLAVIFQDGQIVLEEAIVGLAAYAVYVLLLIFFKAPPTVKDESTSETTSPPRPPRKGWLHRLESIIARLIRLITGAPETNYLWAFLVAIALIVVLSYVLIQATIVFAAGLGISPVIVALTLLAAGTSAPDLIASIDVARAGRGGMAVANAIGSDIFDVFIGLGLPWFIAIVFQGASSIHVGTEGLWISIGILVATTLILYVFLETKRRLSPLEGLILLFLYGAFIIYTVLSGTAA